MAFVAVTQIDSPQNIFLTGVDRGAVIAVGIAALALVNDVFLAQNLHTILSGKLAAVHQRVRTFALATLRGESADRVQSANLLREITALHPDISALVIESSAGWARGAAGRTAAVAMVAEVSAAGALASLPAATLPSLGTALARALANAPGEDRRALRLRLQQHMQAREAEVYDVLFACHALDLLTEDQRAQEAIEDLEADRRPACHVGTPIYRSRRAAARNGLRAFLDLAERLNSVVHGKTSMPSSLSAPPSLGITAENSSQKRSRIPASEQAKAIRVCDARAA